MLNTGLGKRGTVYTALNELGITSTFIPDIISAMPKNTSFRMLINVTGIYDNKDNKLSALKMSAGILTIDKSESYTRTIVTTNNSGGSDGCLYIGSINTNTKVVNGWYKIEGEPC